MGTNRIQVEVRPMGYEAPKIVDLGQLSKHVFVTSPPDGTGDDPGAGGTGDQGFAGGVISTTGSSGGLAGLGLIGGLFAALGRRSNQQVSSEASEDEPEPDRANER